MRRTISLERRGHGLMWRTLLFQQQETTSSYLSSLFFEYLSLYLNRSRMTGVVSRPPRELWSSFAVLSLCVTWSIGLFLALQSIKVSYFQHWISKSFSFKLHIYWALFGITINWAFSLGSKELSTVIWSNIQSCLHLNFSKVSVHPRQKQLIFHKAFIKALENTGLSFTFGGT